jgi:hypothetical protein
MRLKKGGSMMENLLMQIGNYGFPMVVAFYLLVRVESKLDALTRAITRLDESISGNAQPPQDPLPAVQRVA